MVTREIDTALRVVTVTDDASLGVALSLGPNVSHEFVTVRSIEALRDVSSEPFDAALIALTTAPRGLAAAAAIRSRFGALPCVVVAREVPDDVPDGIAVLTPPVNVDTIARQLEHAVTVTDATEAPRDQPPPGSAVDIDLSTVGTGPNARLRAGLDAAVRLQELLDRMPELNSRRVTAGRIVDHEGRSFDAIAIVVWAPDGRGSFEPLASHGVPPALLHQGSGSDQPLLRELHGRHDAVLASHAERFSDRFEGLPGLRGDTVMAASLHAGGEIHGVVVLGGEGYTSDTLSRLRGAVGEHALALAIAAHLELVRMRPTIDLSGHEPLPSPA